MVVDMLNVAPLIVSVTVHVNILLAADPLVKIAVTVVVFCVDVVTTSELVVPPVGVGEGVTVHTYVYVPEPPVGLHVYTPEVCV